MSEKYSLWTKQQQKALRITVLKNYASYDRIVQGTLDPSLTQTIRKL